MARVRADIFTNTNANGAPTFTDGVVVSGVATATTFVGDLTGTATSSNYASAAGIATVSQGLSGNPTINVSGVNNTGVSSAKDFRLESIAEKTTLVNGNSVNLSYNTGGGNVAICTNATGNITLNVTNIPSDSTFDNNSISFSVITVNSGIARSCTAVTLNGVNKTIKWFGGSLSEATSGVTTSNGYDIYTFVGINTVGSATTTTNYIVLGSVSGGYR